MTAQEAQAEVVGPRAGSLAPSVTAAPSTGGDLGVAAVDPDAEPEAHTHPDAGADALPTLASAQVEAFDPADLDHDDPTATEPPFPDLPPSASVVSDPLASPLLPTEEARTSPPPLPEEARAPLRLVSEPDGEAEPPVSVVERPVTTPKRGPTRPRTGSRPAIRAHSRDRSTSGRAFGTNPPPAPTPPPVGQDTLQSQLEDYTPPLRREESVLEEAEALRHRNLYKFKRFVAGLTEGTAAADGSPAERVRALLARGRRDVSQGSLRLASRIGQRSMTALQRFEKLPRKKQVLWVAAPYAVAMLLVGLIFGLRGGDEAPPVTTLATAGAAPAAMAPIPALVEPEAKPEAKTEPEMKEEAPAAIEAAEAAPAVAEVTPTTGAEGPAVRTISLPRRSKLFVRPDARSRRPIRLRKGTTLTVYPDFPAPEGWHLVQTKKGSVGFVSALHLDGQADPMVDKKRKKRRRRRRR